MAERKKSAGAAKTDSTVTGADWEDRDLSGEVHARVAFVAVNMIEAANNGASFTDCTFRNCQFNVSRHTDAAFVNCTFTACSFFDTRFTDCKFVGSKFERCIFDLMHVVGGNWTFVNLTSADLRKATFSGTRMRDAELSGARCEESSLRDVDLSGASLYGANFTDCDLRGSDLSGLNPEETKIKGAVVTMQQAINIAIALGLDVRPD